jgi:hypothetical protein
VKVLSEILHILLISRGFFFDNPLFFKVLSIFTTKKTEKPNNICNRRNHCAAHFSRVGFRSAPQRTSLSFTADSKARSLPFDARPGIAADVNFLIEMG